MRVKSGFDSGVKLVIAMEDGRLRKLTLEGEGDADGIGFGGGIGGLSGVDV